MRRTFFKGRFYETYYFASRIRDILCDRFAYLRLLNDFYGDDQYLNYIKPFDKYSAFHCFIEFIVSDMVGDMASEVRLNIRQEQWRQFGKFPEIIDDLRLTNLPINTALNYYNIEHSSFLEWLNQRGKDFLTAADDDVDEYNDELSSDGTVDLLVENIVPEVFFLLFQNRGLLLLFNDIMANQVTNNSSDGVPDEYLPYFDAPGKLKRVSIPSWVKRAVYFRDRGFCTICNRDLTHSVNATNVEHYDHIVPLSQGGLNDVSNIQLLCQDCNLKKQGFDATTSDTYEAWYPMNDDRE